jgi:hypothetical protein
LRSKSSRQNCPKMDQCTKIFSFESWRWICSITATTWSSQALSSNGSIDLNSQDHKVNFTTISILNIQIIALFINFGQLHTHTHTLTHSLTHTYININTCAPSSICKRLAGKENHKLMKWTFLIADKWYNNRFSSRIFNRIAKPEPSEPTICFAFGVAQLFLHSQLLPVS